MKPKSNAHQIPLPADLAEIISRTGNYTDFMSKELVLRCNDCNQVLQVGSEQMQAFLNMPDEVLCLACNLLKK